MALRMVTRTAQHAYNHFCKRSSIEVPPQNISVLGPGRDRNLDKQIEYKVDMCGRSHMRLRSYVC